MALPRSLISKIYDIKAHDGRVTSLDLGETGRVLVTGSEDRNVNLWEIGQNECFKSLTGHNRSVDCNDTTTRLWDVQNENNCIKVFRGHISYVNSAKFSPDGLWIASAGLEGSINIWDMRKSKQIMEFPAELPVEAIKCIQFHPFEFLLAA